MTTAARVNYRADDNYRGTVECRARPEEEVR